MRYKINQFFRMHFSRSLSQIKLKLKSFGRIPMRSKSMLFRRYSVISAVRHSRCERNVGGSVIFSPPDHGLHNFHSATSHQRLRVVRRRGRKLC